MSSEISVDTLSHGKIILRVDNYHYTLDIGKEMVNLSLSKQAAVRLRAALLLEADPDQHIPILSPNSNDSQITLRVRLAMRADHAVLQVTYSTGYSVSMQSVRVDLPSARRLAEALPSDVDSES